MYHFVNYSYFKIKSSHFDSENQQKYKMVHEYRYVKTVVHNRNTALHLTALPPQIFSR